MFKTNLSHRLAKNLNTKSIAHRRGGKQSLWLKLGGSHRKTVHWHPYVLFKRHALNIHGKSNPVKIFISLPSRSLPSRSELNINPGKPSNRTSSAHFPAISSGTLHALSTQRVVRQLDATSSGFRYALAFFEYQLISLRVIYIALPDILPLRILPQFAAARKQIPPSIERRTPPASLSVEQL